MNFCAKLAGTLICEAVIEVKTAENVVVSPLGFNIVLNMLAKKNSTDPASEHLSRLLQLKSDKAAGGLGESDPLPSKIKKMLEMNNTAGGFSLKCVNKAFHDKAFPLQPNFHQGTQDLDKILFLVYCALHFRSVLDCGLNLINKISRLINRDDLVKYDVLFFLYFVLKDRRAIVDRVNTWVKEQTKGMVSNSTSSDGVTSLTRLLLVNALTFKGNWSDPFDPELTEDREFQLLDGKSVMVPFMSGCQHFYHGKMANLDVIKIPYSNRDVSMYIFLPTQGESFESVSLILYASNFLYGGFKMVKPSNGRKLLIPKFNVDYQTDKFPDALNHAVKYAIRLEALCADNTTVRHPTIESLCDQVAYHFGDLPYDKGQFVGNILQNSAVRVDEAGTEAAGSIATCLKKGGGEAPPQPPIVVDRPFLFAVLEEKSQLALFYGAVTHPRTT